MPEQSAKSEAIAGESLERKNGEVSRLQNCAIRDEMAQFHQLPRWVWHTQVSRLRDGRFSHR
jgi:hypothetical protein